jgi:predicted O-methyltransferase YrrM
MLKLSQTKSESSSKKIMRLWQKKPTYVPLKPEEVLQPLPEPFRSVLLSMYAGEPQLGTDRKMCAIDTSTVVGCEQGMWLYNLCRELRPKKTIEIGLAYGYSTIYLLAALHENGEGAHTAIDPFQFIFHHVGSFQAEKVGMQHVFQLLAEKSVPVMADLNRKGEQFEFIFVDGNHRFDDVMVDFTLSAEVNPIGGYIVLDDMWMPSIQRAAAFIRNNRKDYVEVPTPINNIAVFNRIAKDERRWDDHVDF